MEEGTILKQDREDEWEKSNSYITWYYAEILGKHPFLRWW